MKVIIIVPTYNACPNWIKWIKALESQDIKLTDVLVIDSSSDDETVNYAEHAGFNVQVITKESFGHGVTRQMGVVFFS